MVGAPRDQSDHRNFSSPVPVSFISSPSFMYFNPSSFPSLSSNASKRRRLCPKTLKSPHLIRSRSLQTFISLILLFFADFGVSLTPSLCFQVGLSVGLFLHRIAG